MSENDGATKVHKHRSAKAGRADAIPRRADSRRLCNQISLKIEPDELVALDAMARDSGCGRSAAMRNLIRATAADHRNANSIDFLSAQVGRLTGEMREIGVAIALTADALNVILDRIAAWDERVAAIEKNSIELSGRQAAMARGFGEALTALMGANEKRH